MGRGINKRQRQKRATVANHGNLLKASLGKRGATAHMPLPDAPKPEDMVERLPASLRKIMALKNAAAKKGPGKGSSSQEAGKQQKKSANDTEARGGPASASGRDAAPEAAGKQQQKGDSGKGSQQQKQQPDKVYGNVFEKGVKKGLKERKKLYLKAKTLKKKLGKRATSEDVQTEIEKQLQEKSKVKFGDVVDAPLQVQLKRKHWAKKQELNRTANERCKEVFMKQMQQAQGQLVQVAQGQGQGQGAAKAAKGQQQQAQQKGAGQPLIGLRQQAAAAAAEAARQAELEQLRLQTIEAYRSSKKGGVGSQVGDATLSSLAALVKRNKGQPAATHTLS